MPDGLGLTQMVKSKLHESFFAHQTDLTRERLARGSYRKGHFGRRTHAFGPFDRHNRPERETSVLRQTQMVCDILAAVPVDGCR